MSNNSAKSPKPNPSLDAVLDELDALSRRFAAITADIAKKQPGAAAALRASPTPEAIAAAADDAARFKRGADTTDQALNKAVSRISALTESFEVVSREVRRAVLKRRAALRRSREANLDWEEQRGRLISEAVRGVGVEILKHAKGDREVAKRYFNALHARLEDPVFMAGLVERPIDDVVEALCRKMGVMP